MRNLKIENNKIEIDLSVIKKNIQKMHLKNMIESCEFDKALKYLSSFSGVRQYSQYLKRFSKNQEFTMQYNKFLDLQTKLLKNLDVNHKPISNSNDYLGIEIECFIPRFEDEEGNELNSDRDNFYELSKLFSLNKIKGVSIKNDGSIRETSGHFACEITVLTKLSDLSNLEKTCKLLNKLNAKVNKSCGLHVHIDARNMNDEQVLKAGLNFKKSLPVLASLVPKSRRENNYCKLSVSKLTGSRYHAINLTAFKKYKTIEIRLHSSTTDFKKIVCWIDLLVAIKNSDIKKTCKELNDLTNYVNIKETILEYFSNRVELFKDSTSQEINSVQSQDGTMSLINNVSEDAQDFDNTDIFREAV